MSDGNPMSYDKDKKGRIAEQLCELIANLFSGENESEGGQNHDNTESEGEKGQQRKNNVKIITALNSITDQLIAKKEQEKTESDGRKKREITELILLFITVFITAATYCVFNKQLLAMRADQRPFIGPSSSIVSAPEFRQMQKEEPGQILWRWHFTNYGKSTAQNVRFDRFIKIGEGPYQHTIGNSGPTYVGEIYPTMDITSGVGSLSEFTENDFERLKRTDQAIGVLIDFDYFDGYGKEYQESICYVYSPEMVGANGGALVQDPKTCKKCTDKECEPQNETQHTP
jgi:hypothetical protein